jgi:hypothetical protein
MNNLILLPVILCDYGCGRMGVHKHQNGKWCCDKYVARCPTLKKKNREANLGEKNHFFNKHHTEEALKIIGAKSVGRKTFLGKHHTLETRELLRIKNTGKHPSEETKEKNRIASTGKVMPPRTDKWRENQSDYMSNGGSRKANIKKHKKIRNYEEFNDKELYYKEVWKFTRKSMKKKFTFEELKQRGNKLGSKSLDHVFSIIEGFRLGILPSIIGCAANLELMDCNHNNVKKTKCNITLEELFKKYDEEKG